jgi:hypothetical protein
VYSEESGIVVIPDTQKAETNKIQKIKINKRIAGMVQIVECFRYINQTLNSIPSIAKEKKKKQVQSRSEIAKKLEQR